MPYFMLCIFQQLVLCTCSHLCSSSWQFCLLSSFLSYYFFKIKFYTISWVASCSKRLETVVFCSVEFLRFLRLFSCLCSLYDRPLWFLKAILVLVSSAHKCILLTHFSTTIWHLWLQFATRKASRENCGIWLGQMSSFLFPHFWPRQRFKSIPKLAVSELQKQIF